ncbi:hypothetical protein NC651_027613 [Populus alba x Populus x berolinensis]|nr:hypothetical protein NC651_027613 [Populus alba x Populus x berolinensis]
MECTENSPPMTTILLLHVQTYLNNRNPPFSLKIDLFSVLDKENWFLLGSSLVTAAAKYLSFFRVPVLIDYLFFDKVFNLLLSLLCFGFKYLYRAQLQTGAENH